jgi:hypothetical protein
MLLHRLQGVATAFPAMRRRGARPSLINVDAGRGRAPLDAIPATMYHCDDLMSR